MRKTIKGFIIGFIVCGFLSTTVAFAAGGVMKEIFFGINVVVDGQTARFPDDMRPFIMDGRTFLPLRAISELLGKPVDYDASTNTAYVGRRMDVSISNVGNTSANIKSGGYMAIKDDRIYYDAPDGLYSMKTDGSDAQKLINDRASYINVIGDRIYY